ncbi:glycosyltransferase family 4 protein [Billgrantia antri]|uniref:Glycosyltransferase family 4 protein n=1 Tax=Halomonas sulfidivorans TaxID=2733488 RepID=A0ABX7WFG6_9GAMM|nr:glycosyltransferase family 1 protein [Halomonas sulfidivorans]QTP58895.1 glycosyltransferase family 4 protein [Halomonas sulfidivorans]
MKLTIGLDALTPPLTGIGYYTLNLLEAFRDYPDIELSGISYRGLWSREQIEQSLTQASQPPPVQARQGSSAARWHRLRVAARDVPAAYHAAKWWRGRKCGQLLANLDSRTIYHESNFVGYPFRGKTVITVHDLSHSRFPEAHPPSRVAYLNRHLPKAVQQASAIIAVSESTKRELLELGLETDPSRIHVTHLGCEAGFHPRDEPSTQPYLQRLGLRWRGFVLAVATLEPRKNFEGLLRAYQALPPELAREYPLVLAGGGGWKGAGLKRLIAEVKPPHRVIVTGYLQRPEVQALMASAAVFAYPSLYEGFGLPVLEAMASGTPVLTSDNTSLGEIASGAAMTVPPHEIEAIEQGLTLLLRDDSRRDKLRALGLQRAGEFSWQRCAAQTLEVYRMVDGA